MVPTHVTGVTHPYGIDNPWEQEREPDARVPAEALSILADGRIAAVICSVASRITDETAE
ncbi:hypothetical protein MB27_33340 [Actinoplanes utahensis]|uniref:Uncharacterized protein n=2 Tax=Actinoplanes utahensis TaxID=1869 RepID=A0A0A6UH57_ACTUT|nr:hypothetical protein MB27_33340 [Actinoplanes utahensis]